MGKAEAVQLSVVVPVFNEEAALPELLRRTSAVLQSLPVASELVLVDDGSTDGSAAFIRRAVAEASSRIVGVFLRHNAGQHAAILAGMRVGCGAFFVTMDADLQNPPEEIPRLLERLEAGYDVVGSVRAHRKDPFFRRLASRCVNRLVSALSGGRVATDCGCMLRGYARSVVEAILGCRERGPFIPLLALAFSKNPTEMDVAHAERAAGCSKYGVRRLFALLRDVLATAPGFPLRRWFFVRRPPAVVREVLRVSVGDDEAGRTS